MEGKQKNLPSDLTCAIIGRISAFIRSIHKALLATPWLFPLSIEEPSTLLLPLGNDNEKRTLLRTSIIRIAPQKEGNISNEFSGEADENFCCKLVKLHTYYQHNTQYEKMTVKYFYLDSTTRARSQPVLTRRH